MGSINYVVFFIDFLIHVYLSYSYLFIIIDLKVNKLEVLDSINDILVTDEGDLDILLTDAPYIQYLPMKKSFENLIITNPIKLRNKINNAQLQRLNPVMIDDDSYELEGDVTIDGRAEVIRWLKVEDLKPQNGNRSLGYVFRNGAKLTVRVNDIFS